MDARNSPRGSTQPLRIGAWLVHRRLISRYQLLLALKRAYRKGYRLGDAMVDLRFLDRSCVEAEVLAMTSFNSLFQSPTQISAC